MRTQISNTPGFPTNHNSPNPLNKVSPNDKPRLRWARLSHDLWWRISHLIHCNKKGIRSCLVELKLPPISRICFWPSIRVSDECNNRYPVCACVCLKKKSRNCYEQFEKWKDVNTKAVPPLALTNTFRTRDRCGWQQPLKINRPSLPRRRLKLYYKIYSDYTLLNGFLKTRQILPSQGARRASPRSPSPIEKPFRIRPVVVHTGAAAIRKIESRFWNRFYTYFF